MADHCIFCRIVVGESAGEEIYGDELTLAFMDIRPANDSITWRYPKRILKQFEMPAALFGSVTLRAAKVAEAVNDDLQPGDLSVLQANGPLAEQTVLHAYIHILPRRQDDNLLINGNRERTDAEIADRTRMAAIAARRRGRLRA
jgi:histidine triad (HIT) family protein